MRRLVTFGTVLLFLCVHGQGVVGATPLTREFKPVLHIIGGENADAHAHPYQAALDIRREGVYKEFCSGALLTFEWILTAAHCVNFTSVNVRAILGANNLTAENYGRQNLQVENIVIHPEFDRNTLQNDIALLQIKGSRLIENLVHPIRLPSNAQKSWWFWNSLVTLSGWGYPNARRLLLRLVSPHGRLTPFELCFSAASPDISPVLKYVSSRTLPTPVCQLLHFSLRIGGNQLCVSGWFGKGTCNGDDGGPLIIDDTDGQKTLVGIASFNSNFGCEKSFPMVFTKVSSYLDWIHEISGVSLRN